MSGDVTRVDVFRNGALWLLAQKVSNTSMWGRVKEAAAEGDTLKIKPTTPPVPTPVPPGTSPFAGKGAFSTTNPASALGRGATWRACQMDPEGMHSAGAYYWMSRPTQAVADQANALGVPFIAQAENQPELDVALGLHLTVPKALIGNPHGWTQDGFDAAAAQGWDLILEWYKNAHPWEAAPDAANYPRFVNVCFGIYSESGVQQIPLADYRSTWRGSFSVWASEYMTPADWAVFQA